MMLDIAEKANPNATPMSTIAMTTSQIAPCAKARMRNGTTLTADPATRTALAPNRADNGPDHRPNKNMVAVIGSTMSPDSVTLAEKPYPELEGVCTNSGRKAKIAYIP